MGDSYSLGILEDVTRLSAHDLRKKDAPLPQFEFDDHEEVDRESIQEFHVNDNSFDIYDGKRNSRTNSSTGSAKHRHSS